MTVTRARSLLKAVSYRILGSLTSFTIAWILTGSVEISGLIAAWDTAAKIVLYYAHERGWNLIKWGRRS